MANWASTSYAIEGSKDSLNNIYLAVLAAVNSDSDKYEEYQVCNKLGFTEAELEKFYLGGVIEEEPYFNNDVLRINAEERWGLQDFHELLKQKFPDITIYWIVEEQGCEIYCTNDKEGKYFSDRYWVDTCIDGDYQSEYFKTEEAVYKWLANITNNRVKNDEDVESFNSDYEDSEACDENFIYIHKFDIV